MSALEGTMPRDLIYGEVANFRTDVAALRQHYESVILKSPPVPYKDGELNYQGWAITSRDGSITDGVQKNKFNESIAAATVPTELCTGAMAHCMEQIKNAGLGFYRARVFRLADHGYTMKFHTDTEYEGWRLHVPIITTKGSFFEWELDSGEIVSLHMPADGRAWFVRVDTRHRAINNGTEPGDRVHLIMSLRPAPKRHHFGEIKYRLPAESPRQIPVPAQVSEDGKCQSLT
jgi:hypothetical protein